jgi:hypothetical protein
VSLRRTLLDAFKTTLNTNTPSGIPAARVRRSLPESRITEPEINIYFAAEDVTVKGGRFGPLVTRDVRIIVECRHVTTDPDAVDTIMDPLMDWVSKAINSSGNLNSLAIDVVEIGSTWTPFYLEKYYPITRTSFVVTHQTSRKDPNAAS